MNKIAEVAHILSKRRNKNATSEKIYKFASAMQLPAGLLPNTTHFEMNSNREVVIEGCKGVLEYDENVIKINTGKMITEFFGRNLILKCLTADSLVIEGFITSIEFIT